ncbi:hypothetical protein NXS19_013432 [Fusarium pseudograminearum]|nr:hypothetical protein NXS19_013432 [Fusarium pseudograminearum]
MDTLKLKKAWEVALAPVKGLPMTAIMMYMSGNSLQIFSIMMVFMAFKNPLMGLMNTNQAFERFQSSQSLSSQLLQVKFVTHRLPACCTGRGNLEDQCHGLATNNTIRLAYVGGAERTFGTCCCSSISNNY